MNEIESYGAYRMAIAAAQPEDYAKGLATLARNAGITTDEARARFIKIKETLLKETEGIEPIGSYRDTNGRIFDCVLFEQQPSVQAARRASLSVARSAPQPPVLVSQENKSHTPAWTPERVCPEGAVALPRYTMEDLIQFDSLRHTLHGSHVS